MTKEGGTERKISSSEEKEKHRRNEIANRLVNEEMKEKKYKSSWFSEDSFENVWLSSVWTIQRHLDKRKQQQEHE
jgi:hypothetical protein